ncbi:hypothetical protein [Shigella boydii]|uniref:hypothetical protein n=1 Tax=Shigella boydii TaxID=621 RepID=UPI00339067E2
MFKGAVSVVHRLLGGSLEGDCRCLGGVFALAFSGLLVGVWMGSFWFSFRHRSLPGAFFDRVCVVLVAYFLRVSDVLEIS